jgi:hypothetical protein
MAASDQALGVLDASAMVAVLHANRVRWKWDDRYTAVIVGKLTRGNPSIAPLEREATIISMCREGCGLYHALKATGISQRRYFAWIAKAHSGDPDVRPYQVFRDELIAAFAAFTARTGIDDPDTLTLLGLA